MQSAEYCVAPTRWQGSRFPKELQSRVAILHEGIDTARVAPDSGATIHVGDRASGVTLRPGDEVITFVNRNLEPYRGFHIFMRALPAILEARPNAHAVIVGADSISYGAPPADGRTWKQVMLEEVAAHIPHERVHFVGRLPYHSFVGLMQVSAAHVYLTYPFVLSWSMLEAMSAGALVIGSSTPPVEEIINHGQNGLLCEFFDVEGIARTVIQALSDPGATVGIRQAARRTIVEQFDLKTRCLPQWLAFAELVADQRIPPGGATR
jgi:glycosyltransferase involved in cell wall biosynthesis